MKLYLFAALACAALLFAPRIARADWKETSPDIWVFVSEDEAPPKAVAPGCTCDKCDCADCPNDCLTSKIAAKEAGRWVQQCDGGKCRLVWVPDVSGAKAAPVAASSACPDGSCGSSASSRQRLGLFRGGLLRRLFGGCH